jgi:TonB family protein
VVRISLLLSAGLIASALLRRRSAALRHAVLALTLCAVPLVPLVTYLLPPIVVPTLATPADATATSSPASTDSRGVPTVVEVDADTATRATASPVPWSRLVLAVVGLVRIGWSLGQLAVASRRAQPVTCARWLARLAAIGSEAGERRPVELLMLAGRDLLAVYGWSRPRLLLPACALAWPDACIDAVLRHELAHVRRGDWLVQLLALVVRSALWWHPLAWLACHRLAAESERACDDAVLRQGMEPSAYADHLVAIARALQPAPGAAVTVPMASVSTLRRRITAMLNPAIDRTAPARTTFALLAVAAALLVLPFSLLRAEQAAQTLQGSVYDPTGAVLPGVTLVLRTGDAKAESTTDAAGQFVFAGVPAGRHVLEAKIPGFHEFKQELELEADADWTRTVTLQVGRLREEIRVTSKRGTAPAATSSGPTPVRVGGNIKPPRKLKDVRPVYPTAMRDEGREAQVTIDAVVGSDGRVIAAHVTSPEIHPDFAVAAVDAVKQWVFSPTLLNGSPIDVVMTVSIAFTLE